MAKSCLSVCYLIAIENEHCEKIEIFPLFWFLFLEEIRLIVINHILCSVCGDVHVGDPPHKIRTCDVSGSQKNKEHTWEIGGIDHVLPVVESFHLYDRVGRAVSHNERLQVDRIPAVMELCIQAGVDIPEYPTRRRDFPVYRVAGRIIDFEKKFPKNDSSGDDINPSGFWQKKKKKRSNDDQKSLNLPYEDLKGLFSPS